MLSKIFDMEEANSYDNLTNEKLCEIRKKPEVLDFSNKDVKFHYRKNNYDQNTQVRIRFLHDQTSPVNFRDGAIQEMKDKYKQTIKIEKAIIHFHGGGFIC